MQKVAFGLAFNILLLGALSLLPFSLNKTIEDSLLDLQFRLRGNRQLADEIVFVFIGAEDVRALGGWPLTRDYYGYMTHVLNRLSAKVIGFDILFEAPNRNYPEFDNVLADFFQTAGNVCLPMTFAELTLRSNHIFTGSDPNFPFPQLRQHAAGIGFGNFNTEPVIRKVPLVASYRDSLMLSFGVELARLYLNGAEAKTQIGSFIQQHGQLRLNHFGDFNNVASISFVELLKTFERAPDSLNFKDKIVLVAATFPGAPTLKATPLSEALPAALIHATVAENLIHRNYLRELPKGMNLIFIILMAAAAWLVWRVQRFNLKIVGGFGVVLLYWVVAQFLFCKINLALPLFYPTLAFLASLIYLSVTRSRERHSLDDSIKQLLQEQISAKETQLEEAQVKLNEIQNHFHQQTLSSEQARQLADERQQTILMLESEIRDLRAHVVPEEQSASLQFPEIIHAVTGKMTQVLAMVTKIGAENIPVLILGETGTGKEMIARAIHQAGKRKSAPFVAVNCGALPETLLESELFGHEKGSFTGATAQRRGRFELADKGTIFLDEISETTPAFQARLLRVLQEGRFERLGGEETIKVDVRVIAASNKNLQNEVEKENFRADLFYRLNGFPISLPPLRQRPDDIPLLATHFLKKHVHIAMAFSDHAMATLKNHSWPGNVRELENLVRRAAILAQSEGRSMIQVDDFPKELTEKKSFKPALAAYQPLEVQILEMLRALKFSRAAISQTAKALGNRDRGTITEYFRGICFEHLVKADFDVENAVRTIAATGDEETIGQVRAKIDEYLKKLRTFDADSAGAVSFYKGLPKKYHPYLQQINVQFAKTSRSD
jgi:transcriptional regulator with GAF, ATPase, and Fis domain